VVVVVVVVLLLLLLLLFPLFSSAAAIMLRLRLKFADPMKKKGKCNWSYVSIVVLSSTD